MDEPSRIGLLLELIEQRLAKRRRRAERAYALKHHVRETLNCRHHGKKLSQHQKVYECRLRCLGVDEQQAGVCYRDKAQICPEFAPARPVDDLVAEFRRLPESDLRLRWPSLGELLWVRDRIREIYDGGGRPGRDG